MDGGTAPAPAYGPLRRFVVEHEDRWTFVLLYVGLAVTLSLLLSLFWLVALLAVHIVFETFTHRTLHRGLRLWGEVLWSVKLDLALLFLAFVLALYLEHVFGLLGLRAAAQAGAAARGGTRIAAWARGIRSGLLTADDAVQVARAAGKKGGHHEEHPTVAHPSWRHRWRVGEWTTIVLLLASATLLLVTPVATDHTVASAVEAVQHELRPFP